MKELKLMIDGTYLADLSRRIGAHNNAELVAIALQLLSTAVSEAEAGRTLLTADKNTENFRRVGIPELQQIVANKAA